MPLESKDIQIIFWKNRAAYVKRKLTNNIISQLETIFFKPKSTSWAL